MNGIHPCYPWRMNVMLVSRESQYAGYRTTLLMHSLYAQVGSTLYVENHASPQSLRIKAKKQCEMYQEIYPGE